MALGWVVFRAPTVAVASAVYGRLFSWHPTPAIAPQMLRTLPYLGVVVLGTLVGGLGHVPTIGRLASKLASILPGSVRGVAWAGAIVACYFCTQTTGEFIYLRF